MIASGSSTHLETRPEGPGSLPVGTQLGRYQVMRRLAMGGMAELYVARQVGDAGYEKVVALKRVLPHLAEDPGFVEMFLNEARLAAALDHSGIAHVLDFGSDGGEHFMALEYVHGRPVLDLLKKVAGKGVPLPVALTIVHEVAGALQYAHERRGSDGKPLGLVHRDVSPSNVLVSYTGDVKLVDFGIAKATAHTRATQTAAIKGKLAYMAPEQVRGEPVDRRSDVFALCVVLYELVLGRRCFSAPGEFALINRVAEGRYARPSKIDPDVDPGLEEIIVGGLSVDPQGRPATARALQVAIEGFADAGGHRISKVAVSEYMEQQFEFDAYPRTDSLPAMSVSSGRVPVAMVAAEPVPARAPWGWIGAALVAGLVLGIGVPLALGGDDSQEPAAAEVDGAAEVATPAAVVAEPGQADEDEDEEDDPVVILEDDPDDGEAAESSAVEPAAPEKTRTRRSRKRRGKRGSKSADKKKPAGQEYLPPSRRPG